MLKCFHIFFWGSAHAADSHHWFPLISIGFQWFSLNFHGFSLIFIDFYWNFMDFHWFSLVFNGFSWIFIDFWWIFIDFWWFSLISNGFSWIFNDFQWFFKENCASVGQPWAALGGLRPLGGWVFMPTNWCFAWGFFQKQDQCPDPLGGLRRPSAPAGWELR